jgi:hypothetical protein
VSRAGSGRRRKRRGHTRAGRATRTEHARAACPGGIAAGEVLISRKVTPDAGPVI